MQTIMASLAAIATLTVSCVAVAQPASPLGRIPCHNYKEISNQLDKRYQESPISIGMQSNGNMLQVYANEGKGSWTILSVTPQGLGCILAAGRNWEAIKQREKLGPET